MSKPRSVSVDTLYPRQFERIMDHARSSYYEILYGIGSTNGWWVPQHARLVSVILLRMGFNENTSLWEADHIKELSAGGESSLENTQTLCVPCHKAKTKKMHADRKFERTGKMPRTPVGEAQIGLL